MLKFNTNFKNTNILLFARRNPHERKVLSFYDQCIWSGFLKMSLKGGG